MCNSSPFLQYYIWAIRIKTIFCLLRKIKQFLNYVKDSVWLKRHRVYHIPGICGLCYNRPNRLCYKNTLSGTSKHLRLGHTALSALIEHGWKTEHRL